MPVLRAPILIYIYDAACCSDVSLIRTLLPYRRISFWLVVGGSLSRWLV